MALQQYTRGVDGTIPVPALLYDDEELLASQDNTGIYDGPQKSPAHQAGTIHVSTHRLFYIDARHQFSHSFAMDLSYINRTEYYAGLFKSSPKVTVYLSAGTGPNGVASNLPSSSASTNQDTENVFESWECEVCGNRNPPGLSPMAARICTLCGVPRSSVPIPIKTPAAAAASIFSPPNRGHLSSSLPASALPSASSSSASLSSHPNQFNTPTSTRPVLETRTPGSIACPACTFLNHPSMRLCEMCTTPLPRLASSQTQPHSEGAETPTLTSTKSAPSSRPASPDLGGDDDDGGEGNPSRHMIKLSFRKGGDKAFYAVLKRSLLGKAWEGKTIGKGRSNVSSSNNLLSDPNTGRSGIHGIMRTVETSAQNAATDMSDALKDLEALMVKAKDMVRLAAELNERLTASSATTTTLPQSLTPSLLSPSPPSTSPSPSPSPTPTLVPSTEPEEATFIRSSLSQLGLQMSNAPVTLDMIRDERKWIEELARELAEVLQGRRGGEGGGLKNGGTRMEKGTMKERGIVALDEIWGGWNRARGVALIPPSTFLLVLPHLPHHTTPPIRLRTFPSGLSVLHTPAYTHASFSSRLASLLALMGPRSTMEVAGEERLTVGLAGEMIGAVEADGEVCRDEGVAGTGAGGGVEGGEVRWWVNVFRGYVWDGQE